MGVLWGSCGGPVGVLWGSCGGPVGVLWSCGPRSPPVLGPPNPSFFSTSIILSSPFLLISFLPSYIFMMFMLFHDFDHLSVVSIICHHFIMFSNSLFSEVFILCHV